MRNEIVFPSLILKYVHEYIIFFLNWNGTYNKQAAACYNKTMENRMKKAKKETNIKK